MAAASSALVPVLNLQALNFSNFDDLSVALAQQGVGAMVASIERTYYVIDVRSTMKNLTMVGDLLKLAYSGTKGFGSNIPVVKMLGGYQALIKESYLASSSFVGATLRALSTHKLAWKAVTQAQRFDKAVEILSRCAAMAGEMAKTAGELVEMTQRLSDTALAALEAASKDEVGARENQQKVQKQIDEFKAREASLARRAKDLADQIEEAREQERRAREAAEAARRQAFIVGIIGAVMQPFSAVSSIASRVMGSDAAPAAAAAAGGPAAGAAASAILAPLREAERAQREREAKLEAANAELSKKKGELEHARQKDPSSEAVGRLEQEIAGLEAAMKEQQQSVQKENEALRQLQATLSQQAAKAQDLEAQIQRQKADLQREQRDANANLAETVTRLTGLGTEKQDLQKAIASLEVAVKTLGKVRTVFENTRLYWKGVEKHCRQLTDIQEFRDLQELELRDDFLKNIEKSALSWLALGKINYVAHTSMRGVNDKIDDILSDLPTKEEADKLVQSLGAELLQQIAADNEQLAVER